MKSENTARKFNAESECSSCGRSMLLQQCDGCAETCYVCRLEKRLVDADRELERLHAAESWLRHIQQSVAGSAWETVGDLYRGKQVFLPQDLLNAIDTVLMNELHRPETARY